MDGIVSCKRCYVFSHCVCLFLVLDWTNRHRQEHRDWLRSGAASIPSDQWMLSWRLFGRLVTIVSHHYLTPVFWPFLINIVHFIVLEKLTNISSYRLVFKSSNCLLLMHCFAAISFCTVYMSHHQITLGPHSQILGRFLILGKYLPKQNLFLRYVGCYYVTLLINHELVSRAKLCLVSVFADFVKDCPKMRNLPKISPRSFEYVAPGLSP